MASGGQLRKAGGVETGRRGSSSSKRDTPRAMPEESTTPDLVELAGRQLEAANRHDLDAFMSAFAPDAVYDASRDEARSAAERLAESRE